MFKLDLASLRRDVATEMRQRTSAFADKHYGRQEEAPKPPKKSERVSKIEDLLKTGAFGCNSGSVAKALSIVVGEEITYESHRPSAEETRVDPFPAGIAVVPTRESGSSFADTTVFNGDSSESKIFTNAEGRQSSISGRRKNSRPATAKEIDTLVASISDTALLRVAASMLASQPAQAAR